MVSLSSIWVKYLLSARFVCWIIDTCWRAVWPRHRACNLTIKWMCFWNCFRFGLPPASRLPPSVPGVYMNEEYVKKLQSYSNIWLANFRCFPSSIARREALGAWTACLRIEHLHFDFGSCAPMCVRSDFARGFEIHPDRCIRRYYNFPWFKWINYSKKFNNL